MEQFTQAKGEKQADRGTSHEDSMDGVHVMLSDTEEEVARSYFDKYVGYSLEEVYNEPYKHESRKQ